MADADIFDCGNKLGFLSANLVTGVRDPKSRVKMYALMNKLIDGKFQLRLKVITEKYSYVRIFSGLTTYDYQR